MPLDLEAEVALLEQHRRAVAAQKRVAQPRLEPVPARRQRAGEIAYVLVIHAEHGAKPVLLHHLARPLGAVLAHAVPVDPLLPVKTSDAEIRTHQHSPLVRRRRAAFRRPTPSRAAAAGSIDRVATQLQRLRRLLAGIGSEASGLNAGDGTYLVVIGSVAGDADRTDHVAILVPDQDAGRAWHQTPAAHRRKRRVERRLLGCAAGERARAEPHAERTPGFPERDVKTQDAGLVLPLERDEVPAGVEHGDRERHELVLAPGLERGVDDG